MRKVTSSLALLTAIVLLLGNVLPVYAVPAAQEPVQPETRYYVNPLYADIITEETLKDLCSQPKMTRAEPEYHDTMEEAAADLREGMEARAESITVGYRSTADYASSQEAFDELSGMVLDAALVHTGNPTEGDYLFWHLGGIECQGSISYDGTEYFYALTYIPLYYTTAAQEAELDTLVAALLNTVDSSAGDYERLTTVYDYICENITYDYEHLDDDSYLLKFTAYAAMHDKTAVCQGYALLLYRLALELGIDCRLISGIGDGGAHGWNIVKLGDVYYNVDSTWDASCLDALGYYSYYLQCEETFTEGGTNHLRYDEYDTAAFHAAYPMAASDYAASSILASGTCGANLTWELTNDGILTISGTGAMTNWKWDDTEAPWYSYRESILSVIVEDGVTTIGNVAFQGCRNMKTITLPDSVTSLGARAFWGCNSLTDVEIPDEQDNIYAFTFSGCSSLTDILIPNGIGTIYDNAFAGTGLTEVTIPDSVHTLEDSVFDGCSDLTEVTVGSGVTSLYERVFAYCPKLETVTFTGSAPHAGANNVFAGSSGVTAYYPVNDASWTQAARDQISEDITWEPYGTHICANAAFVEGKEATCTADGWKGHYACSCGKLYADEAYTVEITDLTAWQSGDGKLSRLDHTYGEWISTDPDKHWKECTCGDKTPEAAHVYDNSKDTSCNDCGHIREIVPPEPFDFVGATMTLGSELAMTFYVEKANLEGTDYYAVITKDVVDGDPVTKTIPYSEWITNGSYIGPKFNGVAAKEMSDRLTVQIFNGDGEAVSVLRHDSIRDYGMRSLSNSNFSAEQKTMLVDMLNYGAAAQEFFSYGTDDLANSLLTAEQKQLATGTVTYINNRDDSAANGYYVGTSLTCESALLMTIYFKNITRDMRAEVTYTDHYGNEKALTITGDKFVANGSYLGVCVDTLALADARQPVTCKIYDGNTLISTVVDSVESYIARQSGDALFDCIMKFAVSAYNSFH